MARKTATTMGLKAVLVGLASLGHSNNAILDTCKIKREKIDDPDGRLSVSQIEDFWNTVANLTDYSRPGLSMSQHIPFGTYQIIDYLFASSSTIEAGLKNLVRFYKLIHQELSLTFRDHSDDQIILELKETEKLIDIDHNIDYELGLILSRISYCLGKKVNVQEVGFEYLINTESNIQDYYKIFNTENIKFSRPSNYIILSTNVVKAPSKESNHHLVDILEKNAQETLDKLPTEDSQSETFLTKATNILKDEIKNGNTSIQHMADCFGMSARTLQRKLKALNVSYSDLLNETRKTMAKELLQDKDLSLTEISFILGFIESSSFHKAFKKWIGMTPSEYRQSVV